MMEPGFDLALHDALERALGFPVKPLVRLDGRTTLNFKAVRETDGLTFAVKCVPKGRQESFLRVARYLEVLEDRDGRIPRRLFTGKLDSFCGYDVICLDWCDGERLFPDQLTDEQVVALARDYLVFSDALQRVTPEIPPPDFPEMRWQALASCRGFWAAGVRRVLENELTEARLAIDPAWRKVIHGDMHYGNFLFKDGRVTGFFDFECITEGCPAEDFIRYFVCAAEHLRWYAQHRKLRILRAFGAAVSALPYSAAEWEAAIDRALADKICHKVRDCGCGFLMTVNLLFRARYYRRLKRVAAEVCMRRRQEEK